MTVGSAAQAAPELPAFPAPSCAGCRPAANAALAVVLSPSPILHGSSRSTAGAGAVSALHRLVPTQCETWQYNQATPVTRLFRMRLRFGSLPMIGWDTYQHGHGRMRGTLLGVVPVVQGRCATFDTSEQVTWLNGRGVDGAVDASESCGPVERRA